jgi:carbon-monoxide dehydrogenase medium subunit
VRHAAFETPAEPGVLGKLLAAVVANIAHHPIRTRGTFCGSLAHADPASEWCLTAVTLGAEMVARSVKGTRQVAAKDFFAGIMATALEADELLVEARLPLLPNDTKFGFQEMSRRAGDFAMAASLAVFRLEGGKIADPRVGVGGAEAVPSRSAAAEALLKGQAPSAALFAKAGEAAADGLFDVLEDARTSAEFRRDLVRAVVKRALEAATR